MHAAREGRGTERENISQGLPGWSTNQLMDSWLNERRYFTAGIFPNVSTTGYWFQVGHYSQIIWPTTTDIGCGMAQGNGFSWLVCRYNPGGNKDGKPVGQMQTQQIASATQHGPPTPRASLFDLGIYGGGAWSTDWFDIGLGSDSLLIGESHAPFIYSLSTQSLGESCPVPTAPNYLELALSFRVGDHYSFRLGVNNLLDRDPPTSSFGMAGSSSDTWTQVYDSLGRYIFAGCTLDF